MAVKLGGAPGAKKYEQNADINVTPFVDIMLVLLIIFMVLAPPPVVNSERQSAPAEPQPAAPGPE